MSPSNRSFGVYIHGDVNGTTNFTYQISVDGIDAIGHEDNDGGIDYATIPISDTYMYSDTCPYLKAWRELR